MLNQVTDARPHALALKELTGIEREVQVMDSTRPRDALKWDEWTANARELLDDLEGAVVSLRFHEEPKGSTKGYFGSWVRN